MITTVVLSLPTHRAETLTRWTTNNPDEFLIREVGYLQQGATCELCDVAPRVFRVRKILLVARDGVSIKIDHYSNIEPRSCSTEAEPANASE